mmetsp:Transcript_62447/g.99286  ORF Transcript_62447/g.99286 Transcript_62447/m.99286 type:complete len:224 (-) Transcript_62447:99-770(-)
MAMKKSFSYQFQYIVVGETSIGKTCLLLQFTTKKFSTNYEVTVGVDFGTSTIEIDRSTRLKLQIWDTSGQDAFQSITKSYYRSAIIALLVYDITRLESFEKLDFWMSKLREDGQDDLVIMLVGNKVDLEHKREVASARGKQYAKMNGLFGFMETSAKTAYNVDECFMKPAKYLYYQIQNKNINLHDEAHQGITIGPDVKSQYVSLGAELDRDKKAGSCNCQLL